MVLLSWTLGIVRSSSRSRQTFESFSFYQTWSGLRKYAVICENILDKFNVGHSGIKVKVIIALTMFDLLIFSNHSDSYKLKMVLKDIGKDIKNLIQSDIVGGKA